MIRSMRVVQWCMRHTACGFCTRCVSDSYSTVLHELGFATMMHVFLCYSLLEYSRSLDLTDSLPFVLSVFILFVVFHASILLVYCLYGLPYFLSPLGPHR